MGDYPTDKELKQISKYEMFKTNDEEFVQFIKSIWWTPEWGFKVRRGTTRYGDKCLRLQLHTGGWSGNEEIIQALKKTYFWNFYWVKSIRGGHYWFEVKLGKEIIK